MLTMVERRSPHGERGLKLDWRGVYSQRGGRSPHGERGLKSGHAEQRGRDVRSLSSRRAWIEMRCNAALELATFVALLTESVD